MNNFVKSKKIITGFLLVFFVSGFFLLATADSAQAVDLWDNMDACRDKGDCTLNDFTKLAVNFSQWLLGVTGSLALLMFIYGGVMFLISAGSSDKVTRAKEIIFGAVMGLVVVFTSYLIIGFVFRATGADSTGTAWENSGWFKSQAR